MGVATQPGKTPDGPGPFYKQLWTGVPRHLGFLLPAWPVAVVGYTILLTLFVTGVGTLIIYVGVFLLLGALYTARAFGTVELTRLRWAGQPAIDPPRWIAGDASAWRRTFSPFATSHYWLYLLHGIIINPVVSIVTWVVTVFVLSAGLGGVTYWIWNQFVPQGQDDRGPFSPGGPPFDSALADNLFVFVIGLIFLAVLPFVTHGLVLAHHGIAQGMLGGRRIQELQQEVTELNTSRGAAVSAEHTSVRRLERDIHDGPQQRLIRMQMDLAAAERKVASGDAADAQSLLAEARSQTGDALEELRALSRGLVAPILQDRGLIPALESTTTRCPVPVRLENNLDAGLRLSPEIERNAYFIAAELLTNVAKHSGAAGAVLRLDWDVPDDGQADGVLRLEVVDNGHGGASLQPGHGLHGIEERLTGLRGTLGIDSPEDGPTAVVVRIPAVPEGAVPEGGAS
ncbi:sensor histidine kinase [Arthrobacter castelli]|uniref:sensor histidine kinase n=1 Tax=Arthrobacter castelli TaxID=271431 RepID=UPI000424F9F9|nr:sensor histidine kinase [Arthrobacter castelli]